MIDFKMFYGLSFNPFEKGQQDILYESIDYKETIGRLEYLKTIKGFGLLLGRSGVGKTFTLKKFCESLNPGLYKVIYLPMSTLTSLDFYRSLAEALGLEPRHKKIDNFKDIQECLKQLSTEKRITPVIILDEAQYLRTDILNDLKILFNFDFDSKNYAILILSGSPLLVNTLNKAVHEALKQRIVTQYQILGLDTEDITLYINTKLQVADRTTPLFDTSAITALSNGCNGSIRKLNNMITQAMIIGAKHQKQLLDIETIREAADEIN